MKLQIKTHSIGLIASILYGFQVLPGNPYIFLYKMSVCSGSFGTDTARRSALNGCASGSSYAGCGPECSFSDAGSSG